MNRSNDELYPEEAALVGRAPVDPEQASEEQRKADERKETRRLLLTNLLQDPMFRELLWEQLVRMGAFDNAFGAGPTGFPDPLATQFQLGRKAAGWDLWEMFDNAAPDLASLMRREGMGLI